MVLVQSSAPKGVNYPKLMISQNGTIIFAHSRTINLIKGTVLVQGNSETQGTYSESFDAGSFENYDGELTLSNN